MTVRLCVPPAPVGQQAPPVRAAAFDSWRSLRGAHGALLLTTGTACGDLDSQEIDTEDHCTQRCPERTARDGLE
jgi:hypothetical protein